MKKEIQELQTKIERSEGSEYSQPSQYTADRKKQQLEYYMPSSRGPSSKSGSQGNNRVSGSLVQAGHSIIFQKNTIDGSPARG